MEWKKWRNHLSTSQHLISFCCLGCDLFTNGRILRWVHSMLSCVMLARRHTHVRLAGSQACKWWDTKTVSPDILQVPVSWILGFLRFDESLWLLEGKKVDVCFAAIIKRPWRPAIRCNLKSSQQAPLHNIDLINLGMTCVLQTARWKISLWCKHTRSGDDPRRHVIWVSHVDFFVGFSWFYYSTSFWCDWYFLEGYLCIKCVDLSSLFVMMGAAFIEHCEFGNTLCLHFHFQNSSAISNNLILQLNSALEYVSESFWSEK